MYCKFKYQCFSGLKLRNFCEKIDEKIGEKIGEFANAKAIFVPRKNLGSLITSCGRVVRYFESEAKNRSNF
jgi:hypothetical protein